MKANEKKSVMKREAVASTCPNCWGVQEYEGAFCANDQLKIDLHNVDQKKGWIQGYVTRKIMSLL